MNKLLSMSFVFVFIGLVSLALYTSPAHSESPFETPPKGGLPACTEEVDICTEKVNRCNESLSTCTTISALAISSGTVSIKPFRQQILV